MDSTDDHKAERLAEAFSRSFYTPKKAEDWTFLSALLSELNKNTRAAVGKFWTSISKPNAPLLTHFCAAVGDIGSVVPLQGPFSLLVIDSEKLTEQKLVEIEEYCRKYPPPHLTEPMKPQKIAQELGQILRLGPLNVVHVPETSDKDRFYSFATEKKHEANTGLLYMVLSDALGAVNLNVVTLEDDGKVNIAIPASALEEAGALDNIKASAEKMNLAGGGARTHYPEAVTYSRDTVSPTR
ncbi:MAG: hypothetical protein EBR02_06555 [Alphaproteobacteria bacterium]|nr:hypothetical protein [Alphaproteobacteria bacterium]